jgi:hypothetical protein
MDYFTQPGGANRDEVTPLPARANSTSSRSPNPSSRRGSLHAFPSRPRAPTRPSTIRIRRLPSSHLTPQINVEDTDAGNASAQGEQVRRRRSSSEPQRPYLPTTPLNAIPVKDLTRQRTEGSHMPSVREEPHDPGLQVPLPRPQTPTTPGGRRRASTSVRAGLERIGSRLHPIPSLPVPEYESGVVDLLDVVGTCPSGLFRNIDAVLTSDRSRGFHFVNAHERSKLPLRPRLGKVSQSPAYLRTHPSPYLRIRSRNTTRR